jgi:hypothetical protein
MLLLLLGKRQNLLIKSTEIGNGEMKMITPTVTTVTVFFNFFFFFEEGDERFRF